MTKMRLVNQTYGIAMAQCTFGGPTGLWLECTAKGCHASHKLMGAPKDISDADAAKEFRKGGWTGNGDKMMRARCPSCSK